MCQINWSNVYVQRLHKYRRKQKVGNAKTQKEVLKSI